MRHRTHFRLFSSSSTPSSGLVIFLRLACSSSVSPPGLTNDLGGVLIKQILLDAVGSIGGRYLKGLLMVVGRPFWKTIFGALIAWRTSCEAKIDGHGYIQGVWIYTCLLISLVSESRRELPALTSCRVRLRAPSALDSTVRPAVLEGGSFLRWVTAKSYT